MVSPLKIGSYGRRFIFDNSLVLYAPLWHPELTGSPFLSKDLNAFSCAVTGATWGSQGRTFDGTDDLIVTSANIGISGNAPLTIIAWVKPAAESLVTNKIANIVGWGWADGGATDPATACGCSLATFGWDGAGHWKLWLPATTTPSTTIHLAADIWYCLGATYDGTTIVNYNNGAADGSGAPSVTPNFANTPVYIGRKLGVAADRLWLKGTGGEVFIYNRALTAAEILRSYNSTKWRYS